MHNYVAACTQCNTARGTLPAPLFARYVRRFGPVRDHHMATRNRARRRAAEHMRDNGLPEHVINDILATKIREAFSRQLAG